MQAINVLNIQNVKSETKAIVLHWIV